MIELAPVLTGCRILVTAQRRSEELASALERRGAVVDRVPALSVIRHVDEQDLLRRTFELLTAPPDIVVVTTAIGFRQWMETVEAAGLIDQMLAVLGSTYLVARGPKAQGALQSCGLVADRVAESETSAEIREFLIADGVAGRRIAVQHHGALDQALDDAFREAGADVVPLAVYKWGPPPDAEAVARSARGLGAGEYDAVAFTSAPAVLAWLDGIRAEGVEEQVRARVGTGELMLAAVGSVTAEPLGYAGLLARQPTRPRMGALARLIIEELGHGKHVLRTQEGSLRVRAEVATLDHRPLAVPPSSLAVLRRLAATPGHVVSRDALLDALPGGSDDPHRVEVAVARLRESLRASGVDARLVRTVVKRGYLLAGRT